MHKRLLWKVMALNFPVIALVIGIIWLSIDFLAADYFMELMNQYQIAPNEIHQMFVDSMHRYLAWASTIALLLAVAVSYLLSNRVLGPLKEVSEAIHKMRAGDRDARARTLSNDEIGDLANAFNLMAHQIQEAEVLRESMIVDLAHELRTPVTNISGYVEGLRDRVIEPDNDNLAVLARESQRLGDLVESLLDLSRADAAKFSLHWQAVEVADAIAIVMDANAGLIRKKQLNIRVTVDADADYVTVDKEKLIVVLGVLLQNAGQYAPAGSNVLVHAQRQLENWCLRISNPSEPLSEKDLSLIFERFYRTEKSRSRHSGGAGIGLAIVKKLVTAHGGSVGADYNDGRFSIWLAIPLKNNKLEHISR